MSNAETQATDQRLNGKQLGTVSGSVTDAAGNPVLPTSSSSVQRTKIRISGGNSC